MSPGFLLLVEHILNSLPDSRIDDGGVFARMQFILVPDFAHVRGIGQQFMQGGLGKRQPAAVVALAGRPALVAPATAVELSDHADQRLMPEIQSENSPNATRFMVADLEFRAVRI